MSQSGYVHLEDCNIVRETSAAVWVEHDGLRHWIPKSQIANPGDYSEGDEGVTVSITEWIAEQKGIEL
ncbi:MAG: hypothetical protein C0467_06060 [Planctomycetaceae bacterium]|nr:hypothetical protein [Planctomycetaceae bacterium]